MTEFRQKKQAFIDAMLRELADTPAGEQYFDRTDVEDCDRDLGAYLDKLAVVSVSGKKDQEIAKLVRWIFDRLAAFGSNDQKWDQEYLTGWIHTGYNKSLTDLILDAAFAAGWKRNKPVVKKMDYFRLEYRPSPDYSEIIREYGTDKFLAFVMEKEKRPPYFDNPDYTAGCKLVIGSGKTWVSLVFDHEAGCFRFNANPYGESHGISMMNVVVAGDYSVLSFDVLSGTYKSYSFRAQHECDRIIFALFRQIHGNGFPEKIIQRNHCNITLEAGNGVLSRLETTAKDDKGNNIKDSQGMNVWIGMQGFDAMGELVSCAEGAPPAVTKRFVIYSGKSMYDIIGLCFRENTLMVETEGQTFGYEIKTIPVIMQVLKEIPGWTDLFRIIAGG